MYGELNHPFLLCSPHLVIDSKPKRFKLHTVTLASLWSHGHGLSSPTDVIPNLTYRLSINPEP